MSEKIYTATKGGKLEEVQLPQFICHKIVRAAQIVAMAHMPERKSRLALAGACHVDVSMEWIRNKIPQIGGYFVEYEDGYSSYSPAKAFEEGYKPFVAGEGPAATLDEGAFDNHIVDLLIELSKAVADYDPSMEISIDGTLKSAITIVSRWAAEKGKPSAADLDAHVEQQADEQAAAAATRKDPSQDNPEGGVQ